MSDERTPNLELMLEKLRSLVEIGFEKVNGSITLILQRLDQVDGRHAELAREVEETRDRLAEVEKNTVTRAQLAERTRQIIAVVSVLVTVAGVVIALISLTRG
ncbi:hypothetical protein C1I98_20365 [Spongiactinospora gelatinilytica]|uniref:Uncharacterized protein n=1 Tax=Spongiactinospora gelatinilytica TaxID=2666298 RepID=A0A2W2GWM8_9ACTN|nr:hypothetical protein [Spongiactinospora gelatinilytica]PZG42020.1 hypothetical protein C1I98_20365 [Spongiactinospora gelatinilytica]